MRYDEFKDTGYRPPELGDNGKPPYQIVFDHDFESKIIRVLMPGFAVNGTYFVIVENDNDKASFTIMRPCTSPNYHIICYTFQTQYKPMYTHLNVVSYPRYPGKDPVTLTPMILEKKIPKDGSNGFDKQIVIYAALAQVAL